MESHGGGVELVGLEDGVLRLRLHGSCDGCPASASTLELAIRQALDEAAPDLDGIEVEGLVEQQQPSFSGGALPLVAEGPSWTTLDVASPEGDRASRATVERNAACSWRTSAERCSPTGTPAPAAVRRSTTASSRAACSRARRARGASSCRSRAALVGGTSPCSSTPVPLLVEDGAVKVAVA